jgi:probable F420-dependent oxidoreductase
MKVRIAVTPPVSALHEHAFGDYLQHCEKLGFDTVWLSDIPLGALGDPLISLTYAAAATSRLKLGANIVPLGRNPMWLAKQLAQLDRMSNGRLLLSFVPGLGQAAERSALGYADSNRGHAVDEIIGLLRRWWAGESISATSCGFEFKDIAVLPTPQQQPLEIWLGGKGPAALSRVARLADGWLTAVITPAEAAVARAAIEAQAVACGREIDAEHFGISVPFARDTPTESALAAVRQRREDKDVSEVVAVGADHFRALIAAHIDAGLSKFVVRPVDGGGAKTDWRDELEWLAESVLPLQT